MGPVALFILRLYTLFMIAFFSYCLLTTPTSSQRLRDARAERAARRRARRAAAEQRFRPQPTLSDDPWARYTRESSRLLTDGSDREGDRK